MQLTPHEQERLLVHVAADVARDRQAARAEAQPPRGGRHPHAWVLEAARDGRTSPT